jgi:bla regulator protein BlaR1
MIAAWMLYASAVTAFLGLGAVAVEKSLRFARQPGRWILATAIVGAVFVPVVTRSESAAANAEVAGFSATAPTASLAPLTAIFPNSAALQSLDVPLIALWIGVTLVLVVLLFSTQAHLAKRVRAYREENLFGTKVLRSTALGPAVVGWLKTAIVIPAWVDDVGRDWRALMVKHEREHLRGWDAQLLSTAVFLVILQPWNLPLWGLLFRLRRSIELDCDQRVLKSGVDVGQYGNLLLEMSRRRMRFALPIVGLAVKRSFLARRVETMTMHTSSFRYPKALLACAFGGAFLAIACELPAPTGQPDLVTVSLQEIFVDSAESNESTLLSVSEGDEINIQLQPTSEDLGRIRQDQDPEAVLRNIREEDLAEALSSTLP